MNVDESLEALLVTLQVLGRPTLLAYVERARGRHSRSGTNVPTK